MVFKKQSIAEASEESGIGNKDKPESMNGSAEGWRIQARVFSVNPTRPASYLHPSYGSVVLTTEWQTIEVFKVDSPFGVPTSKRLGKEILEQWGMLDRDSAVALGYTFIAQNDEGYFPQIEVRIVPYTVEYSMKRWKDGEPILLEQHMDKHQKNHRDAVFKGTPDIRDGGSKQS